MDKSVMHENYRSEWETPQHVFDTINKAFRNRLKLDVAASKDNTKCEAFITKERDALTHSWSTLNPDHYFWCNPPFDKVKAFLRHANQVFQEGEAQGVMLVPSNQETEWFRTYITDYNRPRLIWPKRISFLHPDTKKKCSGNTVGSVLIAFVKDKDDLVGILDQPWIGNL